MTVNVPLLPRQGSGSSSDPHSQLASSSLTVPISTSPPSSAQSSPTPTRPTDPQSSSSSPTSSSTTFSSITSSTSASSPDDPSSTSTTSTTSSSVIVSSSMATSSSFSSPSSSLPTPSPSNSLPTSSTNTPASSPPATSVTGTGVPRSLTATMASSSTATASPPPPSTTNEPPPLTSTNNPTTPASSPSLPASTSTTSEDPVGGNLSNTASSTVITTSTSTITSVGGSDTQPGVSSSSTQPGVSSSSTQPGFLVTDRSSGVTASATPSSSNPFSLTGPVTFTTTNPAGSTITTVPDFFTTVFVTTRANGEPMTVSEIVANPTGILSPGENRSQDEFFRNKGAVAGVFLVVGLTATAIVVLGIFAIWKRRQARRQRDVDLATGAKGASRARSPLEPDEAGQDPGIYAVAARHSPVETRSGAPGPGEESSVSFGYGPSVYGSGILLNLPAQATNVGVPPEQQPHHYYPYLSGRRSPSPGEEHPSFARGPANSSNAPPAYFSAPHSYSRMKTPSPVFGGPLVSVQDSSTNHIRGPPPSAYNGVIFSDSKQPSSEGHGSSVENRLGPGLESPDTPSGIVALPPTVAYAYEPEPVTWNHRIVGASPVSDTRASSPRNLQVSTVEQQEDPQSNRGSISNRSASVYSQDWEAEPDVRPTLRVVNDPRISPELGMRLRGGLASEHSFGPRDDEDWSRRVGVQMIANDSTLQVANPAELHRPTE